MINRQIKVSINKSLPMNVPFAKYSDDSDNNKPINKASNTTIE